MIQTTDAHALHNRHTGEKLALRRMARDGQIWLELKGSVPPHREGPPLHVHYEETEEGVVVAGTLSAMVDGRRIQVGGRREGHVSGGLGAPLVERWRRYSRVRGCREARGRSRRVPSSGVRGVEQRSCRATAIVLHGSRCLEASTDSGAAHCPVVDPGHRSAVDRTYRHGVGSLSGHELARVSGSVHRCPARVRRRCLTWHASGGAGET
jgi:hypothetical protein